MNTDSDHILFKHILKVTYLRINAISGKPKSKPLKKQKILILHFLLFLSELKDDSSIKQHETSIPASEEHANTSFYPAARCNKLQHKSHNTFRIRHSIAKQILILPCWQLRWKTVEQPKTVEQSFSSDLMNKHKYPSTEQWHILHYLRHSVRPVAGLILTLYIVYYYTLYNTNFFCFTYLE